MAPSPEVVTEVWGRHDRLSTVWVLAWYLIFAVMLTHITTRVVPVMGFKALIVTVLVAVICAGIFLAPSRRRRGDRARGGPLDREYWRWMTSGEVPLPVEGDFSLWWDALNTPIWVGIDKGRKKVTAARIDSALSADIRGDGPYYVAKILKLSNPEDVDDVFVVTGACRVTCRVRYRDGTMAEYWPVECAGRYQLVTKDDIERAYQAAKEASK